MTSELVGWLVSPVPGAACWDSGEPGGGPCPHRADGELAEYKLRIVHRWLCQKAVEYAGRIMDIGHSAIDVPFKTDYRQGTSRQEWETVRETHRTASEKGRSKDRSSGHTYVSREAVLERARRLQRGRAGHCSCRPRQRREGLVRDGWRVLPRTHAKYDGEMGFVLDGTVYTTRRGPAEHRADGSTTADAVTMCLGQVEDLWPRRELQDSEEKPRDSPQCPESGSLQLVTKPLSVGGRPQHHLDIDNLKSLASDGLSTREIAARLGVSHMTVARRLSGT